MSSLQAHLEGHDLAVNPLGFRRDCPVCRAERAQGQLPSASLVPPRACAAMTAAVLATSAVAPAAVAAADGQGLAVPAPASPPPPRVSGVEVGGGGAAPVNPHHGTRHEPANGGERASDGAAQPGEGGGEIHPASGAVASRGGGSEPRPAAPRGRDGSADSGDAPAVQPTPAAAPSRRDSQGA